MAMFFVDKDPEGPDARHDEESYREEERDRHVQPSTVVVDTVITNILFNLRSKTHDVRVTS